MLKKDFVVWQINLDKIEKDLKNHYLCNDNDNYKSVDNSKSTTKSTKGKRDSKISL